MVAPLHTPLAGYITTQEAAARLAVSLPKIQAACRAYRERLTALDLTPPPPVEPLHHEIACIWTGTSRRITYFVDAQRLALHFVNRGPQRKRGRPLRDERGVFVSRLLVRQAQAPSPE